MMKFLIHFIFFLACICGPAFSQTFPRPDVCPACVEDTTGGYISIEDTVKHNPVCNYELLSNDHLILVHQLSLKRAKIKFFPHNMDVLYRNSGDSRGHVIPFEDLAWSDNSAKASMNHNRNLAPQPQNENIGTKYACEQLTRSLAVQYGTIKVFGGTFGTLGIMKGINKPAIYWTVVETPLKTYVFWMPTTGGKIGFKYLNDPDINITYVELVANLGFDPKTAIQ